MVTIITKNSSTSCRSARRWLDTHDINYEEINISRHPFNLTRDILIQILSLEEERLSALYVYKLKKSLQYYIEKEVITHNFFSVLFIYVLKAENRNDDSQG